VTGDRQATPSFEGKVALVTGGASGIGRATATLLGAAGARVLVTDIDGDGAEVVAAAMTAAGGEAGSRAVDVSDPTQVAAMVDHVVERFGRLDVAFNNAGVSGTFARLPDQTLADWEHTLTVNLTSVFLCLQAEIPVMLDTGGGAIVNTSSSAGLMGMAKLPAYVAAKHAVIGLTKSVALEYARKGVRVNAVCPGTVRTTMLETFAGSMKAVEDMGSMAPIGRVGEADEIAEAVVWLCSDAASFVTGHALAADGGVLAT
jgi:NAD(P)-dependent dehydrogenase (short-subunit alcohol dehydrogenase family)